MKITDVSMPLSAETEVYPGDPPVAIDALSAVENGDPFTLTRISMSSHAGTHLDAPSHVLVGDKTIDDIDLATLVGSAWVVDAADHHPVDANAFAGDQLPTSIERLLIKTGHRSSWLSADAVRRLIEIGPGMIGFDGPSVDSPESESLEAHKALLGAGIAIVENLDLSDVQQGSYFLICLPLKLVGVEGFPVRAILIEDLETG
ncbi:MAG: cyclase family protein [SAR202 cluster bacterium]|jgi:arylformamidase|nr:cyclase family protein [SAR202 cluster bacterium]MDP7226393.1 cyclase family protein [SAR202 cluster bacterium]